MFSPLDWRMLVHIFHLHAFRLGSFYNARITWCALYFSPNSLRSHKDTNSRSPLNKSQEGQKHYFPWDCQAQWHSCPSPLYLSTALVAQRPAATFISEKDGWKSSPQHLLNCSLNVICPYKPSTHPKQTPSSFSPFLCRQWFISPRKFLLVAL